MHKKSYFVLEKIDVLRYCDPSPEQSTATHAATTVFFLPNNFHVRRAFVISLWLFVSLASVVLRL